MIKFDISFLLQTTYQEEYQLCASILKSKPGTLILAETENDRQKRIKKLDLDFLFVVGQGTILINM